MRFACALALLALAAPARAEDVDNPEFASWAKLKKGTVLTLKMTDTANCRAQEQIVNYTLEEIDADRAVIVMRLSIETPGGVVRPNPYQFEVAKTKSLAKGEKKEDVLAGRPAGTFEEGQEALKLDGKELKTRWFKYKTAKREGQVWLSDDVPNRLVQRHENFTGGDTPVFSIINLVEIKRP